MMKNLSDTFRARFGTPRMISRALLYSGAAVSAALVAGTASYAVVSALYPRQAAPAAVAVTQPGTALPDRSTEPTVLAGAPAAQWIDVTPLSLPPQRLAPVATAPEVEIVPIAPAPAALPAPGGDLVVATKSVADQPVPQANPTAPGAADMIAEMPARALSAPAMRPDTSETAAPASFAALAEADATARTEATLGFAAPTNPTALPQTETLAAAPMADPEMPRIRPQPRPETVPVVLAAAGDIAEAIPAIRPAPRPEIAPRAEITRTAATDTTAPAPRRSGGLFSGGGSSDCGSALARSMPRRSGSLSGGEAFFANLGTLSGSQRDAKVINELARGNMPSFLRDLQSVTFRGQDARGRDTEIVICVTPDYLALGSDRDYVRVPLGLPAAARIAGRFGMRLPTPRMVDAIYAQADVKLSPAPMQAGPQMSSTAYFLRHNATIESQLKGRHGLVAGQKKDVVMASRMASAPGRVAIYGWHRSTTSPIQPVSTVHGANYADYSHGIRLVSETAYLNGKPVVLDDLLESSRYAYLLNKEGPLPGPVIRTASR